MSSTCDLSETLYLQLRIIGFPNFLKEESRKRQFSCLRDIDFTTDMFSKVNKLAFQAVYYFLFKKLASKKQDSKGSSDWEREARSCFPCLDQSQEKDFRKLVLNFLEFIHKDPDFHLRSKLPFSSILLTPGGTAFVHLTLRVVSFVASKFVSRESRLLLRKTTPGDDTLNKIKETLNQRSQERSKLTETSEKIHAASQSLTRSVALKLNEYDNLKDSLVVSKKKFASLLQSSAELTSKSKDCLEELKALQVEATSRNQISCVDTFSRAASDKPLTIDLHEMLQRTLNLHKSMANSTAKVNAPDLLKMHQALTRDINKLTTVKEQVEFLPKTLEAKLSATSKEAEAIKQLVYDNPVFQKEVQRLTDIIGIRRPIPDLRFRAMKPTSEEQVQRWKSLVRPKTEDHHRLPFDFPAVDESNFKVERTSRSPTEFYSFNVSNFDHSIFGSPVNQTVNQSLGLLNIPETDSD